MRRTILAVALAGMVASPVLAAGHASPIRAGVTNAGPATALNLGSRSGAPMARTSRLNGEGNGLWLIGAAGVVAGVIYAFHQKNHDDEEPASP